MSGPDRDREGPGRRRTFAAILVIAAGLALAIAAIVLWIAAQHNPQGEYFDPVSGRIELTNMAVLFGFTAGEVFLVAAPVTALIWWLASALRGARARD